MSSDTVHWGRSPIGNPSRGPRRRADAQGDAPRSNGADPMGSRARLSLGNISGRARIALEPIRRDNAKALGYSIEGWRRIRLSRGRTRRSPFWLGIAKFARLAGCARRGDARLDVQALLRPIADVWAQARLRDLSLPAHGA